jgi:hypothetical protein
MVAFVKATFRRLFETIVDRCMAEGLVGAEGTLASKQRWDAAAIKDGACRAARKSLLYCTIFSEAGLQLYLLA